jgi:arginyl-tRNA synthetase
VLTGDLDRALAAGIGSAGTWRPCPPGPGAPRGARPGCYATSVAFLLASACGGDPAQIAARLAARLTPLGWVRSATVTGGGYLTVTVTADALATLAVRIAEAGDCCARSGALAGRRVTAPRTAALASARTWQEARDRLGRHVTGRLAEAAGATVIWMDDAQRPSPSQSGPPVRRGPAVNERDGRMAGAPGPAERKKRRPAGGQRATPAGGDGRVPAGAPAADEVSGPPGEPGEVADAIAFAGEGPVRFALCRLPPGRPARLDPRAVAAHHLGNPAYAVRYAHAHAASVLRQAAGLGLGRGEAAGFRPGLLAHPSEQALLGTLSWLPERVAGAARRGRPDVVARYLEEVAAAWLGCHERCPAAWPGMTGSPEGTPDPGGGTVEAARLWLATAAVTVLAAGLRLLGVDTPEHM